MAPVAVLEMPFGSTWTDLWMSAKWWIAQVKVTTFISRCSNLYGNRVVPAALPPHCGANICGDASERA